MSARGKLGFFFHNRAETGSPYAVRFRTILSQFQAAVDRVDDKRTTWSAMTVALWQQGLKPNVRCLMLNDKPVTSLKDAIDSARRHEDTGLAGGHISTLYQQVPHRALGRFASHPSHRAVLAVAGRIFFRERWLCSQPSGNRPPRVCIHPTLSKNNHTIEQCFTRRRDQREAASQDSPFTQMAKAKKKHKRRKVICP